MINSKVPSLEKWTWQGTTRSSPHDSDEDNPLKRFLIFKIDCDFQYDDVRQHEVANQSINQFPQHNPSR
jgi:hypothetical protein